VAAAVRESGQTTLELRQRLAAKVFALTAGYDHAIATWMASESNTTTGAEALSLPERLLVSMPRSQVLRYGENPHQPAALYGGFLDAFEKLHGKELSYNNIIDMDAAATLIEEFDEPAAAIIKHTNPCGCAVGQTVLAAYQDALRTDPTSAFGGIIVFNREVNIQLAETLNEMFSEVIIAPAFADDALDILRRKRDRRLVRMRPADAASNTLQVKSVRNGYLCQMADTGRDDDASWRCVTRRTPTADEQAALAFAWKVVKHVKSNAIVYTDAFRTLGVGAGQMSRVDSSAIAVSKAANARISLDGAVVASDAFFPFADGLLEAVKAGATAVIQPGGSVRDDEVIAAADEHEIAMILTGRRHFRH
ncbi:MAG: bifunctional phosphoribosylaminoimidazolecarboxamide formyltransferase/IMP cyclohydrolase, partial [Bacteroidetes bacterium]|nr:bifunctional phosphoribosylaminoimidazolecarboxamide formyltransferase/IMP cyclohydrolase [Bacteroidota bacterium]